MGRKPAVRHVDLQITMAIENRQLPPLAQYTPIIHCNFTATCGKSRIIAKSVTLRPLVEILISASRGNVNYLVLRGRVLPLAPVAALLRIVVPRIFFELKK